MERFCMLGVPCSPFCPTGHSTTIATPPVFDPHVHAQDERLDELVPRVVVEKFAKAYIDGYITLLQHQLLYPPQPVAE